MGKYRLPTTRELNASDNYDLLNDAQKRALVAAMQRQFAEGYCNNAIKRNCWAPPLRSLEEDQL